MSIALRASCLCTSVLAIRAGAVVCATCSAPVVSDPPGDRLYSQIDGERPPGAGRARYLRAWRHGRDAGDAEMTADGRARLMTAAAWARHGASSSLRRPKVVPIRSTAPDVLDELGLATRRTGT